MQIITAQNINQRKGTPASRPRPARGLSTKKISGYMRFTLFLGAIGIAYVFNSHLADRQVREMERLETKVKDLKSNYHMRQSVLLAGTRYSEIELAADTVGLVAMSQPPYQLFVNLPEPEPFVRNLKRRYTEIKLSDTLEVEQTDTLSQAIDSTRTTAPADSSASTPPRR
jgi:hypothetical protein